MGQSEAIVAEIKRSAEELLRWVKEHPNCTLRDLEERIQEWKNQAGVQLLEASVAMQGTGRWAEGACVCGGQWVFQGYRERQVMTSQGQGFPVFHGCGPMSKIKPRSALALRARKPSTTNR
jgi:hypothetical protein